MKEREMLEPRKMKSLRWNTDSESNEYMAERKRQNLKVCVHNKAENWMNEKLKTSGKKFSRQARWGYRLFDFWFSELGIAVEVDGLSHKGKEDYDAYRDEYNYRRSGIVVIRVKNFDEDGAVKALEHIANSESWKDRRDSLGLNVKSKKARRHLVS